MVGGRAFTKHYSSVHSRALIEPLRSELQQLIVDSLQSEIQQLIVDRLKEVLRPLRDEISIIKLWLACLADHLEFTEPHGEHTSLPFVARQHRQS